MSIVFCLLYPACLQKSTNHDIKVKKINTWRSDRLRIGDKIMRSIKMRSEPVKNSAAKS